MIFAPTGLIKVLVGANHYLFICIEAFLPGLWRGRNKKNYLRKTF
ncbi:hypothetical protein HMPREF2531_00557 [Bacteroides intestinalis]|uniref:Uncharacterized protein n=1 Tax=Bacteroides intestinalis TaxID=329854 RepID=A0A139LT60_9BACE|nr:hypothetical protein HMPREF2531_00557 [Bacteroides intestinalis]